MRIAAEIVTTLPPPASISSLSTTPIANRTDRVFAGIVTEDGMMSAPSSLAVRNTVIAFLSFSASSSVRARTAYTAFSPAPSETASGESVSETPGMSSSSSVKSYCALA